MAFRRDCAKAITHTGEPCVLVASEPCIDWLNVGHLLPVTKGLAVLLGAQDALLADEDGRLLLERLLSLPPILMIGAKGPRARQQIFSFDALRTSRSGAQSMMA